MNQQHVIQAFTYVFRYQLFNSYFLYNYYQYIYNNNNNNNNKMKKTQQQLVDESITQFCLKITYSIEFSITIDELMDKRSPQFLLNYLHVQYQKTLLTWKSQHLAQPQKKFFFLMWTVVIYYYYFIIGKLLHTLTVSYAYDPGVKLENEIDVAIQKAKIMFRSPHDSLVNFKIAFRKNEKYLTQIVSNIQIFIQQLQIIANNHLVNPYSTVQIPPHLQNISFDSYVIIKMILFPNDSGEITSQQASKEYLAQYSNFGSQKQFLVEGKNTQYKLYLYNNSFLVYSIINSPYGFQQYNFLEKRLSNIVLCQKIHTNYYYGWDQRNFILYQNIYLNQKLRHLNRVNTKLNLNMKTVNSKFNQIVANQTSVLNNRAILMQKQQKLQQKLLNSLNKLDQHQTIHANIFDELKRKGEKLAEQLIPLRQFQNKLKDASNISIQLANKIQNVSVKTQQLTKQNKQLNLIINEFPSKTKVNIQEAKLKFKEQITPMIQNMKKLIDNSNKQLTQSGKTAIKSEFVRIQRKIQLKLKNLSDSLEQIQKNKISDVYIRLSQQSEKLIKYKAYVEGLKNDIFKRIDQIQINISQRFEGTHHQIQNIVAEKQDQFAKVLSKNKRLNSLYQKKNEQHKQALSIAINKIKFNTRQDRFKQQRQIKRVENIIKQNLQRLQVNQVALNDFQKVKLYESDSSFRQKAYSSNSIWKSYNDSLYRVNQRNRLFQSQ